MYCLITEYVLIRHFLCKRQSLIRSNQKNKLDGHTSRIFACAFNPRSQHEMISGGWDDTVMCWDDRQPYATRYFVGVHMCGEGLDFDKPGRTVSAYEVFSLIETLISK